MSNTLVKDKSFYLNLLTLTFPIVLQQLLRISVNTINSILLGSIDQLQMSAVSQADQVFFIFYTVCNGFAVGTCVLVAQYWGRKNTEAIRTILAISLRAITVFGLAVSALVMLFPVISNTAIVILMLPPLVFIILSFIFYCRVTYGSPRIKSRLPQPNDQ